jgi:competence transcription factor ComK
MSENEFNITSIEEEQDLPNQNKKINVFIDTNIYMHKQYDLYNNSDFRTLSQYISEGKVSFYTHKIVIEEVKKHFRIEVSNNMERYSSFRNKLRLLKGASFSIFNEQITDQDLINTGIALIDKYFTNNKAIVLDYSGISLENIFDDYFTSKFPFENKKDKKSEFPDAVIIASLIKNKPDNGLSIITNDNAWREAFKNDSDYIVMNSLKDFLDQISKSEVLYAKIYEYYQLDSSKQRVKMLIEEKIESSRIVVDGLEYDRKGVVSGVDYDEVYIDNVSASLRRLTIQKISHNEDNDNEIEVLLNYKVSFKLTITCYYTDYENSIWDGEEKKYLYQKNSTIYEEHKALENFSLLIKYDLSLENHISESIIDEIKLTLNQYSLLARSYPANDNDDSYEDIGLSSQITKDILCQKCHNHFIVDFSQYVENTSSWEHEEDQMGIEIQYDIEEQIIECPHCSAKYKVSGSYNEYPVGGLDYDNTKIELVTERKK